MADSEELAGLFEATVDELYRYASRLAGPDAMLAEDLVQDAYVALDRELRRGGCPDAPIAWLKRVARNRFLDVARRSRRERQRLQRLGDAVHAGWMDAATDDTAAALLDGVAADQRLALVLRYVDDLAVAEVAAAIGRSVHATESLLARGRSAVRARIAKEGA